MKLIGIYDPYLATFGGGENYISVLAEALSERFTVEIISPQFVDLGEMEQRFGVRLTGIKYLHKPQFDVARNEEILEGFTLLGFLRRLVQISRVSAKETSKYDLFLNLTNYYPCYSKAKKSVSIAQFPFDQTDCNIGEFDSIIKKGSFIICKIAQRFYRSRNLDSYQLFVCYSKFVSKWLRSRWGRSARVLNPPIDAKTIKPGDKSNIILSVGRFFPGFHNKKHQEMIDMFKELVDNGLQAWEYHLAGSLADRAVDQEYYASLMSSVRGYPIFLHPNMERDGLTGLLASSSIFWHATGLDEDEEADPEKMEHFGMSTVEAMAAGSVPVVIDKGGQKEIVTNGIDGYLWLTRDECMTRTLELAADKDLRHRIGERARLRSQDFDRDVFRNRVLSLVDDIFGNIR